MVVQFKIMTPTLHPGPLEDQAGDAYGELHQGEPQHGAGGPASPHDRLRLRTRPDLDRLDVDPPRRAGALQVRPLV